MANDPTSTSASNTGTTCNCPLKTTQTCHPKKLNVKVTPRRRGDAPSTGATKGAHFLSLLKGTAPSKAPDVSELKADEKINRIALPISRLTDEERKKWEARAQRAQQIFDAAKKLKKPAPPTAEQTNAIETGKKATAALADVRSFKGKWFDQEIVSLLERYDLIIETLASYPSNTDSLYAQGMGKAVNTVDIEIKGETEGVCPTCSHKLLKARSNSNTGGQVVQADVWPVGYPKKRQFTVAGTRQLPSLADKKLADKSITASQPGGEGYDLQEAAWKVGVDHFTLKDVSAAAILADSQGPANPLSAVIKFLKLAFSIIHPMDLEFRLLTCGKNDRKSWDPAEFSALVRIYREVTFAVGIKIPAFAKVNRDLNQSAVGSWKKDELKHTDMVGYNKSQERQYNPAPNQPLPTSTTNSDIKTFQVYVKVNEVELNLTELYEKLSPIVSDARSAAQTGRANASADAAALKTNPLQLAGKWYPTMNPAFVVALANLAKHLKEGWSKITDLMKAFNKIMESAPQLGFAMSWEFSFLEGMFEASMQLAQGKASTTLPPEISQRYIPTTWKYKFAISATLFGLKWEGSFGLLVTIPVVGRIEVRVKGQIIGQVQLKIPEIELCKGEDTTVNWGVSVPVCGRLVAVAAVEGLIFTWKREIGIEAGFQIDAGIKWTTKQTESSARIWTLPVSWWFTAVNSRTKVEGTTLHVLFEPTLVFEAIDTHNNDKAH